MEPNICEPSGELKEGAVIKSFPQPILRQPLIFRHQERPDTAQMFQFEEEEDDLDLFDDGEDEYYEDEIYKLVQSYVPKPAASGGVENNNMDGEKEGTQASYFDVPSKMAPCFEELEQKMANLNEEGTVKKEIIRPGNGVKVPQSSRVYYHYMALVEGRPEVWDLSVVQKYPKFANLKSTSNLLEGFDVALRSMEVSEVARFLVYPGMAYGEVGSPPYIPANVKIIYVVEMLHYIDEEKLNTPLYMDLKERSELPFQAIYDVANTMCFEGNKWYAARDYQLAVKKWRKGIQILEEYPVATSSELEGKKKAHSLMCMYSNTAQAYLRLEKPAQACNACELGLQFTKGENSIKLLYRFSKAKLMLKDCDGALQLVEDALKIKKEDADMQRMEREIYLEDAYQRGLLRNLNLDMLNSEPESTGRTSPQPGFSGAVKVSAVQMKSVEEKSSSKGSPARMLKTLFGKKKSEKKEPGN